MTISTLSLMTDSRPWCPASARMWWLWHDLRWTHLSPDFNPRGTKEKTVREVGEGGVGGIEGGGSVGGGCVIGSLTTHHRE